jgi:hypothetical protein
MLTVGSVLIPDLRLAGNFRRYAAEIDKALRQLGHPEDRGRRIVDVLVHSSYDLHDNRSYPSWEVAVSRIDLQVGPTEPAAGGVEGAAAPVLSGSAPAWAGCDATSAAILDGLAVRLPDLGAALKQPVTQAFGRRRLVDLLRSLPAAGSVRFLECSFPRLHTFLLEIHADGRRYLYQAYDGVYRAMWWQGTDEAAIETGSVGSAAGLAALRDARAGYGLGKPIADPAYERFARTLNEAVLAEDWAGFAARWRELPFCPTVDEEANVRARSLAPVLEVSIYAGRLPADPLPGAGRHGALGAAVIPPARR